MNQIITDIVNKFTLCVLLTQLGKTFASIRDIRSKIEDDDIWGRSIHMIFTMNTLLNNSQFAIRLTEIETTYGAGSVVVFASKYDGNFTHVKTLLELQGLCFRETTIPRVVVMCSHVKRFDDGVEFLKTVNENSGHIKRAYAVYDELHKYINAGLRLQIEKIHDLDIVKGILALTASPDNIFDPSIDGGFWDNIHIHHMDEYNEDNYVGCADMEYNLDDESSMNHAHLVTPEEFEDYDRLGDKGKECVGYIKSVLMKHPDILAAGSRSFIPAHIRCVTHTAVRTLIFATAPNAVVVVINGLEKTLQYKDEGNIKTHLLNTGNTVEVSERLSNLIHEHNLQDRPLVITGFNCIGMGQTLTHKDLGSFTSAIFSHLDLSNDEDYQLFGRITGRMKDWTKYVQTRVYCPTKFMYRCRAMEECSRKIVLDYDNQVVSQEQYRRPMTIMGEAGEEALNNIRPAPSTVPKAPKAADTDKAHRVFETQADANKFALDTFGKKLNKRKTDKAPKETRQRSTDENPTVDGILKRMWGLDAKCLIRMSPTNDAKWCIYWRPSKLQPIVAEEE